MICYHGGPISGGELIAAKVWAGRDAMVSHAHPEQMAVAAEVCRSVVLDNGAFSAWKAGNPVKDWDFYYQWVAQWQRHPSVHWAIVPDVIDGSEADNLKLICDWPATLVGVPVWHLHESLEYLDNLVNRVKYGMGFPALALGSSGKYADVGTDAWWARMSEAMEVICDDDGYPRVPLHGLRMLDPTVLAHLPLASADSTNVARNLSLDTRWNGPYAPASKAVRGLVIMDRIESHAKASRWCKTAGTQRNFELLDYGNVELA